MTRLEQLDRLARYFHDRYPSARILDWQEIGEGWETDLFAFSLQHGPGDATRSEQLVIRLFHNPDRLSRAQKEFQIMQAMHRLQIPVPEVHSLVAGDESPLRDPFIVMEQVRGPSLAQRFHESSGAERDRLMRQMAAVLLRIHRVDWKQLFPESDAPPGHQSDSLAYVNSVLAEMRATVARAGLSDFVPMLSWLEDRRQLGASHELCVLHNDFHPDNILMDDDRMVVLDWSFAAVGDYRMDLAWSALLFGVMLGERNRIPMLRTYEQLAGSPAKNFEYFEALKLAMRMVTIGSWLDESAEIPVHKITREAIRGEYKVHILNPYRRLKQITGIPLPRIEDL